MGCNTGACRFEIPFPKCRYRFESSYAFRYLKKGEKKVKRQHVIVTRSVKIEV